MLLSGLLLERYWWGSTFLVNVVASVVAMAIIVLAVPSTKATERVGLDPLGSLLSIVGIGLLVLGIIEGPEQGWTSPITLIGLVGGAAVLAAFVRVELTSKAPLLDPRLFRFRGFATGLASLFLQFFAMFGFFFVSVQYLRLVLGCSALTAAVAIIPMSLVMIPLSTVAATLAERYGQREVGATGLALSAVGLLLIATLGANSSYLHLLAGLLVVGAGAALAMTPATNAIVSSLPAAKQGVASAVDDTARELGGAFGIAMLGSAFNIGYRGDIETQLTSFSADVAEGAHESPAIALDISQGLGERGGALVDIARDSFVTGMRYAVVLGAALLVVGAVYLWLRGPSHQAAESRGRARRRPREPRRAGRRGLGPGGSRLTQMRGTRPLGVSPWRRPSWGRTPG